MKITKEDVIGISKEFENHIEEKIQFMQGLGVALGLVSEFNVIGGQELYYNPIRLQDSKATELTVSLLQEELDELQDAYNNQDVVAQLDAMIDIFYVLGGAVLKSGLGAEFVTGLLEVHKNNMTKFPNGVCTKNEKGKIIKPEGFKNIDLGEHYPHLRQL